MEKSNKEAKLKSLSSDQQSRIDRFSKKAQEYMTWLDQTHRELTEIRANYRRQKVQKS